MIFAVTGGAGYIGSKLLTTLIDSGAKVISVDNLSRGTYEHLEKIDANEKATLMKGDLRDGKFLIQKFLNADAIAHLAALPGLELCRENPEEAVSANIYGTYQILETARKLDISKVVFCSSAAVYGRPEILPVKEDLSLHPLNLYGVTKLAGEKLMEAYWENYGLETISLRFGNVYGVGLYTNYDTVIPKFVKQGLNGEELTVYGDGSATRDFVHIEDIVQAITLSLKAKNKGGEAYNVGGEAMKIGDLATHVSEAIGEVTGKTVNISYHPPRRGETEQFYYDLEKIKKGLEYKPKWSIKQGINQVIKFRARGDSLI
jgi:UDP-glucose 4-epimerase